jgi:hypothetical protein
MTIILDNYTLPKTGHVELNLSFDIVISAEEAQKKVRWWLRDHVGMLLLKKRWKIITKKKSRIVFLPTNHANVNRSLRNIFPSIFPLRPRLNSRTKKLDHAPIQVPRGDFDLAWLKWDEMYATLIKK